MVPEAKDADVPVKPGRGPASSPHDPHSSHEDTPRLTLEAFPPLPSTSSNLGRPLYFRVLHPEDKRALEDRGYNPRLLFELPRGAPQAEVDYLLAKAQALEEGTVPNRGKTDVMLVELQMKANRMLDSKNSNVRVNLNLGKRDIGELLSSWGQSRHTLRGNTTIQEAQKVLGPSPKKKKKGAKKNGA